ncbi:MAG: PDZ domain-containing protein [Panacagrimonas sp.]
MNTHTNWWRKWLPLRLAAAALLAAPACTSLVAMAGDDAPSRKDLDAARADLERAREDLRKAAEQLAEVYAGSADGSPRAAALRYYADPNRGFLGVNIEEGPEAANGEQRGVLVSGVTPGSGADKAGIKSGDLLIAANGRSLVFKPTNDMDPMHKLKEVMTATESGSEVKVEYERGGKKKQVTVVAGRPPDDALAMMSPEDFDLELDDDDDEDVLMFRVPRPPGAPLPPLLHGYNPDLQLARLDADLAGYFNTDEGVLVVKAPRDDALGLKGGDVIQEINGEDVDSPVEVMEQLTGTDPGTEVTMKVLRHGRTETLKGAAPEAAERMIIKTRKFEVPKPPEPPKP